MKRIVIILSLLIAAFDVCGQKLTVEKMEVAPMDLSASTQLRNDRNGNPCGLVKVQLATPGASFEGNVIGDAEFKKGEYWVYMSEGSYMLNVKHASFLPLFVNFRDYDIKEVESKVTYVLTLVMPQMGPVNVDDGMRYLVMSVEPAEGAVVMIDGTLKKLTNGKLSLPLMAGLHNYSVACDGYQTQTGTVNLVEDRTMLPIRLESTMATLSISCATPTASLFVNDEMKGRGEWSGRLSAGSYRVEARQDGYRPQRQSITLAERGKENIVIPALQAIVGNLNVNYQPIDAEVWLDGKKLGVSPNIFRNIMVGSHQVEIRAKHHHSLSQMLVIEENKTFTLEGSLKKGDPVPDVVKQKVHRIGKNGKYGLVDYLGQEIVKCQWADMHYYVREGLICVKDNNGKWGYIDRTGRVVIPCQWADAGDFSEGLARVKNAEGKWGYIDKSNRLVIPCQWKAEYRISDFSEGMARIGNADDEGLIDKTGRIVVPPSPLTVVGVFKEGLCQIISYSGEAKSIKYIDKSGNTNFVARNVDFSEDFYEGMAQAEKNEKWGYIDKTGRIAIACEWSLCRRFSEGLAAVKNDNGKWGFVDKTGRLVISCQWSEAWSGKFSEGLASVADDNDKCGFIDKTGKVVIPCQWVQVNDFEDGVAWVCIGEGQWRLIDKTGRYVE